MLARQYSTMPRNLQKGIYKQKSQKYAFDRRNGKMIDNRDRQWILRIYYCLKQEDHYLLLDDSEVINHIAEWSGCSPKTIENIISSGVIDVEDQRGHTMPKKIPPRKEERIMEGAVRKIQENLDKGVPINAKDIRGWLREVHHLNLAKTTMLDYLKKWGVGWKRLKHSEFRKERAYVMAQREEFLQEIQKELNLSGAECRHRDLCGCPRKRKLVFLDESYLHEHHVSDFGLTIENYPLQKPSGKGRRVVIVSALTDKGWLGSNYSKEFLPNMEEVYGNGSFRYWLANIGGDYHRNFNNELFQEYFKDHVLKYLQEPSLIIMDRAKYHTVYPDNTFIPSQARKKELKDWLEKEKIIYNEGALKEELRILATTHWKMPNTIIQDLAHEEGIRKFGYGHRVLYLPAYHPEYNAIEMAWARIKDYVGKNPAYNLTKLVKESIPKAFLSVTSKTSTNIINLVLNKMNNDISVDPDPLDIDARMQTQGDRIDSSSDDE